MPESPELILVGVIILLATLVRSTVGFGDALVAMPLLAFVVPLRIAAPLIALVSIFNAFVVLLKEWRQVSFRETGLLIITAMAGIPIGAEVLRSGDERLVKALLAVIVLAFSIWSLRKPGAFALKSDRTAPIFGVAAGILGGAYNTAGPPLVVFGTLRNWPVERFRANLQSYFVIASSVVLLMHVKNDLVTNHVLVLFGVSMPITVVAAVIGRRITSELPVQRFQRLVHFALVVIGVMLLVTSVFGPVSSK